MQALVKRVARGAVSGVHTPRGECAPVCGRHADHLVLRWTVGPSHKPERFDEFGDGFAIAHIRLPGNLLHDYKQEDQQSGYNRWTPDNYQKQGEDHSGDPRPARALLLLRRLWVSVGRYRAVNSVRSQDVLRLLRVLRMVRVVMLFVAIHCLHSR